MYFTELFNLLKSRNYSLLKSIATLYTPVWLQTNTTRLKSMNIGEEILLHVHIYIYLIFYIFTMNLNEF